MRLIRSPFQISETVPPVDVSSGTRFLVALIELLQPSGIQRADAVLVALQLRGGLLTIKSLQFNWTQKLSVLPAQPKQSGFRPYYEGQLPRRFSSTYCTSKREHHTETRRTRLADSTAALHVLNGLLDANSVLKFLQESTAACRSIAVKRKRFPFRHLICCWSPILASKNCGKTFSPARTVEPREPCLRCGNDKFPRTVNDCAKHSVGIIVRHPECR